jgi:hypothetical protein
MSKIEISIEDYDAMRRELKLLSQQVTKQATEINSLKPEALRERAINIAQSLANKYLAAIFAKLGFTTCGPSVVNFHRVGRLGENWYSTDNFTVEIGLVLMKEVRQAFIELGVAVETLPSDVAHCNNLPDKESPDRPPICGDCRYFKEQYKLNPQVGDFSCPGHCYLLQVPHPRSKYDPACMQIAPVSRVPSSDNEEHQTHKP